MLPDFDELCTSAAPAHAVELGRSREGRTVAGYRFGTGDVKVSLLAGCHADEPVGPRLLERLARYLASAHGHEALARLQWWIVPHINPDGASRNASWSVGVDDRFDLAAYLLGAVRELPGDDLEFGFPRGDDDAGARPENRAVYDWWRTDPTPFAVHASLHGMAFAGGPWFLIDPNWANRCDVVKARCREAARKLGYSLHDVERHGEKGFVRIERGFCTRPNSKAMAEFFIEKGDDDTARLFRPSSMETIRSFGGDTLTLVPEIPLFVLPGVGERINPTDRAADDWRERILGWKERIGRDPEGVGAEVAASGVRAVPVRDQMRLQWEMLRGGIEQVAGERG
jgi:hypothetical protein